MKYACFSLLKGEDFLSFKPVTVREIYDVITALETSPGPERSLFCIFPETGLSSFPLLLNSGDKQDLHIHRFCFR